MDCAEIGFGITILGEEDTSVGRRSNQACGLHVHCLLFVTLLICSSRIAVVNIIAHISISFLLGQFVDETWLKLVAVRLRACMLTRHVVKVTYAKH